MELGTNHCFKLCLEYNWIISVEEFLIFIQKRTRALQYENDIGSLLFIKKLGIGFLLIIQLLINILFTNDVSIHNDLSSISQNDFTSIPFISL